MNIHAFTMYLRDSFEVAGTVLPTAVEKRLQLYLSVIYDGLCILIFMVFELVLLLSSVEILFWSLSLCLCYRINLLARRHESWSAEAVLINKIEEWLLMFWFILQISESFSLFNFLWEKLAKNTVIKRNKK